jgi:hypothetical protein
MPIEQRPPSGAGDISVTRLKQRWDSPADGEGITLSHRPFEPLHGGRLCRTPLRLSRDPERTTLPPMEYAMKLSATRVRRALDQFDARALPVTHPAVPKLSELYGDHTFFLNDHGLSIVEPLDPKDDAVRMGKVVNLASWKDANRTSLATHNPVPTSVIVALDDEDDPLGDPEEDDPDDETRG